METCGIVTNIQRFSVHDGPGIRTTVFLKGCPLHCRWCHNPETWKRQPEIQLTPPFCIGCGACAAVCPNGCHRLAADSHTFDSAACIGCGACIAACPAGALEWCGQRQTVRQILDTVQRDSAFYGQQGGITLSGGEPLAQPEFALALLRGARERGIGTAVETSGFFSPDYVEPLCAACDWLLWDIKDTDPDRHQANTGADPHPMWENLRRAAQIKAAAITLRCPIIRGVNDTSKHILAVKTLAVELGISRIRLLPFHPFGNAKRTAMGYTDAERMGREYIPAPEQMTQLQQLLPF